MAVDVFSLISPAELTFGARTALRDRAENQRLLTAWLGHRPVNDLVYEFNKGSTAGLAEAANFRAWDAEPLFGRRDGFSKVQGELPPIGLQYVLGEYDRLRLRSANEEIVNLLMRDAARIAQQIDTRFEFARAEALVTGKVTLNDNDGRVKGEVDFGRSSSMSVAPSTLWSNLAASTPIDDWQSWRDAYVDLNGRAPETVLTSTKVRNYLLRNQQIIGLVFPTALEANRPGQIRSSDLDAILSDFDLPAIQTWDARAIDQTGTSRRFIDDDKFLMLPAAGTDDFGGTLWGVTAESQEPEYGLGAGDHPGLVVGAFKQSPTPVRVFTVGAAIGLPILANPDWSMVADVA